MKRRIVKGFAVAAIAAASTMNLSASDAKYIFYFIGDGMGMGPSVAAEMYNRQILCNETPLTMFNLPVAGMALTYSASSPVTDSAAAGTALATGTKTKNGMLGMNPDTLSVTSIARTFKDAGYGVGIATSVAPDDATPGAFYAHVPHRSQYYTIGCQAAESGYDFIAGAGLRGEKDKSTGEPTDLLDRMASNNVQIVRGPAEIDRIASDKVLLLNYEGSSKNNIGYTIDSLENTLTLPVITEACLAQLQRNSPERFFMMIEGGNIDHALHANDGGAAIKEILNFNDAIKIAYDFYLEHPDETLIVITADHDTGGMTVGNPFLGYNARLGMIDSQRISKEKFQDFCQEILESETPYTWDDMRGDLTRFFGFWEAVPVNEAQEAAIKESFEATFLHRDAEDEETLYGNYSAFAKDVFKVFNDVAGIGFVATSHTGNPVPVFAVGVEAEKFMNLNNNMEIPGKILEIAGF